jgi:predicted enzyme related to lactoylglutathione lyase
MRGAATMYVKHLEPMAQFYKSAFGFEEVDGVSDDFRVLDSETWTLSLVQVPAEIAAGIELSAPPVRREQAPIKLSFDVPDIGIARATIAQLGGRVDEQAWEFRGYRHCDFTDPEGNVSQLRERVTTPV